jgi:hypothetical protein
VVLWIDCKVAVISMTDTIPSDYEAARAAVIALHALDSVVDKATRRMGSR